MQVSYSRNTLISQLVETISLRVASGELLHIAFMIVKIFVFVKRSYPIIKEALLALTSLLHTNYTFLELYGQDPTHM